MRAAYPTNFLAVLTREVKWLVENFWEGLRCDVMVPCIEPCGRKRPGTGLYEVEKLIDSKRRRRPDYPCPVCNEWQDIDCLLHNAPAAQSSSLEVLPTQGFDKTHSDLDVIREQLQTLSYGTAAGFRNLDQHFRSILSQIGDAFTGLMQALTDEAKEGPRLFSFEPIESRFWDQPKWMSAKFRLTLWCEHSRMPLPMVSGNPKMGTYELTFPREWLEKAAPFLKLVSGTLGLVLPVVAAGAKMAIEEASYKSIEAQLSLGKTTAESLLKGGEKVGSWLAQDDDLPLDPGRAIRAEGAVLRELHGWLKEKDPTFGGLTRVQNKRMEYLWVHPKFEIEY